MESPVAIAVVAATVSESHSMLGQECFELFELVHLNVYLILNPIRSNLLGAALLPKYYCDVAQQADPNS